jgi:Transposase DDE domain
MLDKFTALYQNRPNSLQMVTTDLSLLPAKLSKRLWVNPFEFLVTIHAVALAQWALQVSQGWQPALPPPRGRGRKQVYQDSSIVVMALIHVAWQMSYEEVVDYFRTHPEAAQAAGFPTGRVIGVSQYWERRRALGILPFWFFFVAMVWQLIRLGVISGTDVILDGTTQRIWFHEDPEAGWSFPKPWKGSVWGYKVHTILCRWSQLPILFLITSANRQESIAAIPLLALSVALFGLPIAMVRADSGYFTTPIMTFIRFTLKASFMIDYNLRRRGKRFLATLFFLDQWHFHMGPRAIIERHFAWAKRYFGLESARWRGLIAAYQHTALVYSVMLGVALTAHRFQRPDLAGSPSRVLALKTLA